MGKGRVRGRPGRIEQGVLLWVARPARAWLALHPWDAAAGVHEHRLGHCRRAEAHSDDVLQGVQGGAESGRDSHVTAAVFCCISDVDVLLDADCSKSVPMKHVGNGGGSALRRDER